MKNDYDPHKILSDFFKHEIVSEPYNGWHCSNVWNLSQSRDETHEIYKILEELEENGATLYLTSYIFEMIRKIRRYERETESLDENIKRYSRQLVIEKKFGTTPDLGYMGIDYYDCPKGGRCTLGHLKITKKEATVRFPRAEVPE